MLDNSNSGGGVETTTVADPKSTSSPVLTVASADVTDPSLTRSPMVGVGPFSVRKFGFRTW